MFYVKGLWHGFTAWWGAFVDKTDAEKLAERINGTVYNESELFMNDLMQNNRSIANEQMERIKPR